MKRDKYEPFELEEKFIKWFKTPIQIIPWQFAIFCVIMLVVVFCAGSSQTNAREYQRGHYDGFNSFNEFGNTNPTMSNELSEKPMTLSQFGTWLMQLQLPPIWWALIILLLLMVIR
jgi:hypothetical protein